MQFGLCLPTFEQVATPQAIARAAQLAEEQGWDSLWVTDHVLMAAGQERPYGHMFEALATLAYAAGMARRPRLGTSVLVLPQRNAILLAKQAATLDALTYGRLILGVAAGWNQKEFGFLGADFKRRSRMLEEQVAVMRALWTQPQPAFAGRFHRFEDAIFSPRPEQPGGIPIWIGGNSDAAVRRAGRIGDGWHGTGVTPERLRQVLDMIQPALSDGRPFALSVRLEVTMGGRLPAEFTGPDGTLRRRLGPSADAIVRDVEAYRAAGAECLVLVFMEENLDALERSVTQVAEKVLPRFR